MKTSRMTDAFIRSRMMWNRRIHKLSPDIWFVNKQRNWVDYIKACACAKPWNHPVSPRVLIFMLNTTVYFQRDPTLPEQTAKQKLTDVKHTMSRLKFMEIFSFEILADHWQWETDFLFIEMTFSEAFDIEAALNRLAKLSPGFSLRTSIVVYEYMSWLGPIWTQICPCTNNGEIVRLNQTVCSRLKYF